MPQPSIFQPLDDFFTTRFTSATGATVEFRFDRWGLVLTDADFTDHRTGAVSAAAAQETTAALVNHAPDGTDDGATVSFRTEPIDDTYFTRLLLPAVPYPPDGDIGAFSSLKVAALNAFRSNVLESSRGTIATYEASTVAPTDWYDSTSTQAWTPQSFTLSIPAAGPNPPVTPVHPLPPVWRIIPVNRTPELHPQGPPPERGGGLMRPTASPMALNLHQRVALDPIMVRVGSSPAAVATLAPPVEPVSQPVLADRIDLDRQRELDGAVVALATSVATQVQSVTIGLEYCLVEVSRPWLSESFIRSVDWELPGLATGAFADLAQLPVGFVAVRNLLISGAWTPQDQAAAASASAFGPFQIDAGINAANQIGNSRMQVIGWLLEALPPLPPHDSTTVKPTADWTGELIVTLPDLALNATGSNVKLLQGLLMAAGSLTVVPGELDGQFGPDTQAAVIAAQTALAIAGDAPGMVGQATWTKLLTPEPAPARPAAG